VSVDLSSYERPDGVDVRDHQSSDLIDDHCDTATADVPLLDVGGYLACGCHGSQREHTCIAND
jgi:hypothetical protein